MKIMICGHARHGKDQFCEYMGLPYTSSSMVALNEVIWDAIGHRFTSKQECFDLRVNHRKVWYDLIHAYNTPDRTRLTRKIFESNDVYCGIRDREEFLAARQQNLFDISIWVDASERVDAEDNSSCTLLPSDCDIIVTNNGTLYDLESKAQRIVKAICPQTSLRTLIVEWADEVFPQRTVLNAIQKMMMEEIPEYLMDRGNPMELADLGILLYDIAHLDGVDLDDAIRRKMKINKFRVWAIDPRTGLLNHVNTLSDEEVAECERINNGGEPRDEDDAIPEVAECPHCGTEFDLTSVDVNWLGNHGYRDRGCPACGDFMTISVVNNHLMTEVAK